jgi:hypothetical protein
MSRCAWTRPIPARWAASNTTLCKDELQRFANDQPQLTTPEDAFGMGRSHAFAPLTENY